MFLNSTCCKRASFSSLGLLPTAFEHTRWKPHRAHRLQKGDIGWVGIGGTGLPVVLPCSRDADIRVVLACTVRGGGGITILQVAANPYISVLGAPERFSRLNLAQAFNSLGTTIAPIVAASFLLVIKS